MSESGANEDELTKQLSGLIKSGNVTEEDLQAVIEFVKKKKKSSSSSCTESSKAPSPPSAMQELKSLPKTNVESQPQVDSEQQGSDKKNKIEQVEPAMKKPRLGEHMATLDSRSLLTAKKEPNPPKSDAESQLQPNSEEEEASDKEKEIEQVESGNKKPRPAEQIESPRNSPVDDERRAIVPPFDVVKNIKRKSKVVKKEPPTSRSSRDKERHVVKHKKLYVEDEDELVGEIKVTGSRKLVEIYQEDFDDKLTDDAGHKSLEKEGNCTVIQKANTKLMEKFGNSAVGLGNLENVYSR
jgi:hypothetical protein